MNSDDFEDLTFYSTISANSDSGLVNFEARKGKEDVIAELIKKNHLENLSMGQFMKLAAQYTPSIRQKKKLREEKISHFIDMSPQEVEQLPLEQRVEYLEAIFDRHQTEKELQGFCLGNKDKLKTLLYGIQLPESFWQQEEKKADRFVAVVSHNEKIINSMKNWDNLSLKDKKATIQETVNVLEYAYGLPLEIGFYTEAEYRKKHHLDAKAHVLGAYCERGKIFFNADRLKESDNYMGVSVVFHEFTHKRQQEVGFENPLLNRLFGSQLHDILGNLTRYEAQSVDPSSVERGDMYALMPAEMHAFGMQKYVEDQIAEKIGIEKTQSKISKETKRMHDKSFAMANILKYRSK